MPKLTIDIEGRLAGFQDSLNQMVSQSKRSADRIGAAFSGVKSALAFVGVGAGLAAVTSSIRGVLDQAEGFNKLAQRTGIAAEALSRLSFAANLADVDNETLATGLKKLAVNMSAAAGGAKEQAAIFSALGVNLRTAEGGLRATDDVLRDVADRFESFEDGPAKAALAVQLFGKSGDALIPFLNTLRTASAEAEKFGVIFGSDFAKRAEEFNDNIKRLSTTSDQFKVAVVGNIIGPLADLLEKIVALKASGGLAASFTLDAEQLQAPTKALAEINREIGNLDKNIADFEKKGFWSRLFTFEGGQADSVRRSVAAAQRTALEALANLEKSKQARNAQSQLFEFEGGGIKKEAPVIGTGAADAAKKFADAEAKLAEQRAKQTLESEQRLATSRLRMLETFYQQGLIGTQDYYDRRLSIQQEAAAKELKAIDAEIALRKRASEDPKRDPAERKQAQTELEDALHRRKRIEEELGQAAVDNNLAAAKATRDYADAVTELNAKLEEQTGNTAEALRLRTELQNRTQRQQFEAAGDTQSVARLDALERGAQAQARINDLRERAATITDRLAQEEERIQNSLRVRAISEIEALRRTGAERERAVGQLEAIATAIKSTADESGIEKLKVQAEGFRVELERLASQADLLKEKFETIGDTALGDFFADAARDIKNIDDAFKRMIKTIETEITRLAAQDLSKKLLGGMSEKGFGFGDFFSKLFKGFGLAGGGGGLNLSSFGPAFATGGSFIVGGSGGTDQTPVMFRATRGERVTITPPGQSAGATTNVFNLSFAGGASDRRSVTQAAAELGRAVGRASRRNG